VTAHIFSIDALKYLPATNEERNLSAKVAIKFAQMNKVFYFYTNVLSKMSSNKNHIIS